MSKLKRLLTTFMLVCAITSSLPTWSQEMNAGATYGPRKQVAIIVFSGLAGAILGLSTLSFYGRPQDKLVNIPIGAAVGIIIGTSYTTFKAATEGRNFYSQPSPDDTYKFLDPELWRTASNPHYPIDINTTQVLSTSWSWTF